MMNEKTKPKERYNDDEEEYDDRSVSERREVVGGNRYRDDGDRDKGRNRDGGRGGLSENFEKMMYYSNFGNSKIFVPTRKPTRKFV